MGARHIVAVCALVVGGCSTEPEAFDPGPGPWDFGVALDAEPQAPGDPQVGEAVLLNGSYMSCGIPQTLWDNTLVGPVLRSMLGADGDVGVPGRIGPNADLPHTLNAFTTSDGADVVNRNCLTCHSGRFDGQLVIGLGNITADFTRGLANGAAAGVPDILLNQLALTDPERSNLTKMMRTASVFGPETATRTIGQNPAEVFTGILLAHHDLETLAWSDEELRPVIVRDANGDPIADEDAHLTSDPPPWWRAKKKHALFYNGMARGDHRGTMALATAICVDNIPEAERVDGLFRDMQAFIGTIKAPLYQRAIDDGLAADGKRVFLEACAGCHGTYVSDPLDDDRDTYPNLLIPLDTIGTDPVVANLGVVHAPEFVDWYNGSFYGQATRAVPNDPFPGYMPPPLDGIWATAPYLHNGSVPTIELVLNSQARPAVWRRVDLDNNNYDEDALGWPWEDPGYSQADAPAEERTMIYDTSYWSQANTGHTFGDVLSEDDRRAVIEYLKTL